MALQVVVAEDREAGLGVDLRGLALAERLVEVDVVVHVRGGDVTWSMYLAPAPRAENFCGRF